MVDLPLLLALPCRISPETERSTAELALIRTEISASLLHCRKTLKLAFERVDRRLTPVEWFAGLENAHMVEGPDDRAWKEPAIALKMLESFSTD